MNDIALNKKASIERCVAQIRAYYGLPAEVAFEDDHLRQDAIAINLQRAFEQCIDLANHAIKVLKLGLPQGSRESFRLLATASVIPRELSNRLEGMVGFRNVLVHQYADFDVRLMVEVIETRLDDMTLFADHVLKILASRVDA